MKKRFSVVAVLAISVVIMAACLAACTEKTYTNEELGFVLPDSGLKSVSISVAVNSNYPVTYEAGDKKFELIKGLIEGLFADGFEAKPTNSKGLFKMSPVAYEAVLTFENGETMSFKCRLANADAGPKFFWGESFYVTEDMRLDRMLVEYIRDARPGMPDELLFIDRFK